MKTNLLVVLFLLLTQVVSAANGVLINGIYYRFDSSKKEAEVTNGPNSDVSIFDNTSLTYYMNTVTVPQSVTYNGVTYKVTSIGENAFAVNRRLKKVNLPESLLSIHSSAFTCCDDMQSIYIPKSVEDIEYNAFYGCIGLNSVVVDKDNKNYDSRNDCNGIIETETSELIFGNQNTKIPYGVTRIGEWAFAGETLLKTIDIPNSVTSIGSWAFEESGLKSMEMPNSIIAIGTNVFMNCRDLETLVFSESLEIISGFILNQCHALKSVIIPSSVKVVEEYAIGYSNNVESITFLSTTPPAIFPASFEALGNNYTITIHVPEGCRDAYENSTVGQTFINIVDDVKVPTGISNVTLNNADTASRVFRLNGTRVSSLQKGINIVNGKKVVVKNHGSK